jgi:succinate dehydrogenase / fumarate reductase cytochrome b subunit
MGPAHGRLDPSPRYRRRPRHRRRHCPVWWLWAAADGADSYETFTGWATHWSGIVVAVGLSWALIQHTLTGLRHFALDIGAGYELSTNKKWSLMTLLLGVVLTAALWAWILRGLWS